MEISLLSFHLSCQKPPPAPEPIRPVKVFTVGSGVAEGPKRYPGKTSAMATARMAFEVPGRLIELPIKEGQPIKKEELLARLDPRDYQAQYEAQEARVAQAQAEFRRSRSLYERRAISLAKFQVAEKDFGVAQAELATTRKAFEDTYLRAPFDGVISEKKVKNFEQVQAKQLICVVQEISQLEIVIHIPEADMTPRPQVSPLENRSIEGINERLEAYVELAALPGQIFPLTLKEFQTQADPITQTFRVTFVMTPPENSGIWPGMTTEVLVSGRDFDASSSNQFLIPASAVFSDEAGASFVWLIDPETMKVHQQLVELGPVTGNSVRIISGLQPGQTIVSAGVHFLLENQKVRKME